MNSDQIPDSPTATLVVVYAINFDNSTGNFIGYGSLVMTTGPLAILHARAASRLLAGRPKRQLTLRLQVIDDTGGVDVADAVVLVNANSDGPLAADPYGPGMATAPQWKFKADTWERKLAEDELRDPSTPPLPAPGPPGGPHRTQLHGPWCFIWPSCPGC